MDSMDNTILRDDSWLGYVGMAELQYVRVEGGLGLLIHKMISALVVEGWFDIEFLTRSEFPRFEVVRLGVDENAKTYRSNGSGIAVIGSMEVIPGRKMACKGVLLKKVEREVGLWEQLVPNVVGEIWVNPCQDDKEVGLEGTYGSLRCIVAVEIWGYELLVK